MGEVAFPLAHLHTRVMGDFAVILAAAGSGTRFGGGDKLLCDLAGRSVLERSFRAFARRSDVGCIVVVTGADRIAEYRRHLLNEGDDSGRIAFVEGGRERWESVMNGLRFIVNHANESFAFVGIHDAARPLCSQEVISAAFESTRQWGAGLPCVPEPATVKRRGTDGCVTDTVDRRDLFQAQTPQCFELKRLLSGYEQLHRSNRVLDLTDDAQVFERMGWKVPITQGDVANVKITTAGDLVLARALIGTGGPGANSHSEPDH